MKKHDWRERSSKLISIDCTTLIGPGEIHIVSDSDTGKIYSRMIAVSIGAKQ